MVHAIRFVPTTPCFHGLRRSRKAASRIVDSLAASRPAVARFPHRVSIFGAREPIGCGFVG